MFKDKKIISIIPARGGSKGILRKNIKLLNGIPLIAYSIEQSLNSKFVDSTYVSTEDSEIKEISEKYGAEVIDRPSHLADDRSSTESVLLHAAKLVNYDFDYIVLLQPTSPLRFPEHIDKSIQMIVNQNADSLLSVCKNKSFLWKADGTSINYDFRNRPRRQDKEWEYIENGSIYVTSKNVLINSNNRLGGKIITYEMPNWMSFEIDDEFDFELVEHLVKTRFIKKQKGLKKITTLLKLIIFDVDGVFTDGSVYLDEEGKESLKFSRIDGKGIELLIKSGFKTTVITSEDSQIVRSRMKKLKIHEIFTNIKDKLKIYELLKKKFSLIDENICFLGDDIQDLHIMKKVGFSCCPANAQNVIKDISHYISPLKGGEGFIRDVSNIILESLSD